MKKVFRFVFLLISIQVHIYWSVKVFLKLQPPGRAHSADYALKKYAVSKVNGCVLLCVVLN